MKNNYLVAHQSNKVIKENVSRTGVAGDYLGIVHNRHITNFFYKKIATNLNSPKTKRMTVLFKVLFNDRKKNINKISF